MEGSLWIWRPSCWREWHTEARHVLDFNLKLWAQRAPSGRRYMRPDHPSFFSFSTHSSQCEPTIEFDSAGGIDAFRMRLRSAPQKGQSVSHHAPQYEFFAFRRSWRGFGDSKCNKRRASVFRRRDRKGLFEHCGDNDLGDRCFIGFYRNGDLCSGAETVDPLLSSLLLILSFDQRCVRDQKKRHVFPRSVLIHVSSAMLFRSRRRTMFAGASDTKKALNP